MGVGERGIGREEKNWVDIYHIGVYQRASKSRIGAYVEIWSATFFATCSTFAAPPHSSFPPNTCLLLVLPNCV